MKNNRKVLSEKSALYLMLLANVLAIGSCGGGGGGGGNAAAQPITPSQSVDAFVVGGTGKSGMLSSADLKQYYNIPPDLDGSGQTIAIIEGPGSGDAAADLNTFSQQYNLPQCNTSNSCFQRIDYSNGVLVLKTDDWGGETALDAQMIHAIAPGAKIVLVIAASGATADLMAALNYAAGLPGVAAISLSQENSDYSIKDQQNEDGLLANFQANQGLSLFASSGDSGRDFPPVLMYPAASPYFTLVGGTKINTVPRTVSTPEIAWAGSSGGYSDYAPMPAWQISVLDPVTIAANNSMRAYPDVAAVADCQSPFSFYYQGVWRNDGCGTSASAPLWAGIYALLGQHMKNKGASLSELVKSTPGGFNGLLYQPRLRTTTNNSFYDITVGANNPTSNLCTICTALDGFDNVTGWGSPNVTNLISYF